MSLRTKGLDMTLQALLRDIHEAVRAEELLASNARVDEALNVSGNGGDNGSVASRGRRSSTVGGGGGDAASSSQHQHGH